MKIILMITYYKIRLLSLSQNLQFNSEKQVKISNIPERKDKGKSSATTTKNRFQPFQVDKNVTPDTAATPSNAFQNEVPTLE